MAPSSAVVPSPALAAPPAGGPGSGARPRPATPPGRPTLAPAARGGAAGQPRRTPLSGT